MGRGAVNRPVRRHTIPALPPVTSHPASRSTAVTAERTVEDPEQGGFARTGGTDHRYKIPLADGKAGVSQGVGAVLKFFTDMLNFQQHK